MPASRRIYNDANSAVQHLASGLGAAIGGQMLVKAVDGTQHHFNRVGLVAAVATGLSLWLAGRVRAAQEQVTVASEEYAGDTTLLPEMSESTLDYPVDPVSAEPV